MNYYLPDSWISPIISNFVPLSIFTLSISGFDNNTSNFNYPSVITPNNSFSLFLDFCTKLFFKYAWILYSIIIYRLFKNNHFGYISRDRAENSKIKSPVKKWSNR